MRELKRINKKVFAIAAMILYAVTAISLVNIDGNSLLKSAYAFEPCNGCDGIIVNCAVGGVCCESANSTDNNCHNSTDECCPDPE